MSPNSALLTDAGCGYAARTARHNANVRRDVPTSLQCPLCGFNLGFESWKYCGVGRLITMEK